MHRRAAAGRHSVTSALPAGSDADPANCPAQPGPLRFALLSRFHSGGAGRCLDPQAAARAQPGSAGCAGRMPLAPHRRARTQSRDKVTRGSSAAGVAMLFAGSAALMRVSSAIEWGMDWRATKTKQTGGFAKPLRMQGPGPSALCGGASCLHGRIWLLYTADSDDRAGAGPIQPMVCSTHNHAAGPSTRIDRAPPKHLWVRGCSAYIHLSAPIWATSSVGIPARWCADGAFRLRHA